MTTHPWSGDMVAAYDKYADEREAKGEPTWRDSARSDFASRLDPGARVLELGAGVGYTSRWFADQGFDVLASDLSPGNVTKCRAKGLSAEVLDMHHLDLPAASFDGIWAASCLMHIADVDLPGVLEGIRRLLVPGGWFWSGTWGGPDREGIWEDDFYEPKRFYSNRSDDRIQTFYQRFFAVESFEAFDPEATIDWHYQMALLRKPADAEIT